MNESFEEHVLEGTKLLFDKTIKGLTLCENGVERPKIPFPNYQFQGLPALDKLLIDWGRKEACAKNEGYSAWHAKYLAACCYLLQGHKEINNQTTTRTIRCAVIMINSILSTLQSVWGDSAYSILPALASLSSSNCVDIQLTLNSERIYSCICRPPLRASKESNRSAFHKGSPCF